MIAQKMMIVLRFARHRHGNRADGVGQKTDDVGPLSPHEVARLGVCQDEGRRDEGLERDRRLNTARRRVQVPDDC